MAKRKDETAERILRIAHDISREEVPQQVVNQAQDRLQSMCKNLEKEQLGTRCVAPTVRQLSWIEKKFFLANGAARLGVDKRLLPGRMVSLILFSAVAAAGVTAILSVLVLLLWQPSILIYGMCFLLFNSLVVLCLAAFCLPLLFDKYTESLREVL